MSFPRRSARTVYRKIVTTEAPGRPRVAWADVRVEDSELSTGGAFLPDARQARALADYFLRLADLMDVETGQG